MFIVQLFLLLLVVITMSCSTYTEINNQNSDYILEVGDIGAKNLDIQHQMLRKNSIEQLSKAGLKEGMIVWDVGCGNGTMTEIIASIVGDKGHVYALDTSKEQIVLAKDRLRKSGYNNVTFIDNDILNIARNHYKKADIVYSRLLLMHIKNPIDAIYSMTSLLKDDGGVISLQESDVSIDKYIDTHDAFNRYSNLVIEYGKINGFDYNIGSKLSAICENMKLFSKVEHYTTSYSLLESSRLLLNRFNEFKNKAIKTKLTTEEECDKLFKELKLFFNDEELHKMDLKIKQHHLLLTLKTNNRIR